MALIQSQAKAPGTGGRAQFVGMALTVAVLIVAAAMVAVLASSLTAKSTGGSIVTTKADPLVQQGAIQFRAAEHAAGAAAGRPAHPARARSSSASTSATLGGVERSAPPARRDRVPARRARRRRRSRSSGRAAVPASIAAVSGDLEATGRRPTCVGSSDGRRSPRAHADGPADVAGPSCCPGMRDPGPILVVPAPRVPLHHLDDRVAGRLPVGQVAEDVGVRTPALDLGHRRHDGIVGQLPVPTGFHLAGHQVAPDGLERRRPATDPDPIAAAQRSQASRRRRPGGARARPGGGRGPRAGRRARGSAAVRRRRRSGSRSGRSGARRSRSVAGRMAARSDGRTCRGPGRTACHIAGRRPRSCREHPGTAGGPDRHTGGRHHAVEVDLPALRRRTAQPVAAGRAAGRARHGRPAAWPTRVRAGPACRAGRRRHRAPSRARRAGGRPPPGRAR